MTDFDLSRADESPEIGGIDDLVAYFREGETPRAGWRIGTEHEKILVQEGSYARVPFDGEHGIEALLGRIAEIDGWERTLEGGRLIALAKDGASITLEPGGQLELSGAPLRALRETCREFTAHVELVKRATEGFGILQLSLGADPLHEISEIPQVPKTRYTIMREYLPPRGSMALHMMHATATVQANYDYRSEPDMASKLRMAMGCSPIVSALFANSPFSGGKENGFVSRRVEIWRYTDPARCGILPFVFERDFGYRDYANWALDVPMFFVARGGGYVPLHGSTFRDFIQSGIRLDDGTRTRPTLADWELHLTTVFPEVRLKRFIEVRGADAVPGELICALPALWKGLFYDETATADAFELVADWSLAEREAAIDAVGRYGLAAEVDGSSVIALARELVQIASAGLEAIEAEAVRSDPAHEPHDERVFLDPLFELLDRGESPGETLLGLWRGEWQGSVDRLIDYATY